MKKAGIVALCVCLLAALLMPLNALAETVYDSGVDGNIRWKIVSCPTLDEWGEEIGTARGVVVSGSGPMKDYGYGESRAPWKKSSEAVQLQSIRIEPGITWIGRLAFDYGPTQSPGRINEIVIPDTVTGIGSNAFTALEIVRLVVPDSVTRFDESPFQAGTRIVCSSKSEAFRVAGERSWNVIVTDMTGRLDRAKLALEAGQTATLKATMSVEGFQGFYTDFDTSDWDVAVVSSDGVVTAKKAGSATIRLKYDGRVLDSCSVTVKSAPAPAPTPKPGAVISAENVTLTASAAKRQRFSLKITRTGDGALSCSSNNASVTVDDQGRVTVARKFVGKAVITVRSAETDGYAAAKKTVRITVKPAAVKLLSATSPKKGALKLKWKKNATGEGYQIQYSGSESFKNAKKVRVAKNSTLAKTISGLSKGKTYWVRVRAYKKVGKTTYFSGWSDVKAVKIKK